MSLGDVWTEAFYDRVGEVHPRYKEQCSNINVLDDRAVLKLLLNVYGCTCHIRIQGGAASRLKTKGWVLLVQIIKENPNETGCGMISST